MWSGSEEGSYLRHIYICFTQLYNTEEEEELDFGGDRERDGRAVGVEGHERGGEELDGVVWLVLRHLFEGSGFRV